MNIPRHDIYAAIHKGLRAFMAHALVRIGRLDPLDAAETAEATAEVGALLDMCSSHLQHENDVIHAAMEARRPGSASAIAEDHLGHARAIAAMRELLPRVPGDPAAAAALYHALSLFIAHNLEHMRQEETLHNAVLWDTHSDDEIRRLQERIVSSLPPAELQLALRWMLPSMSPDERAAMLRGMRQNAPANVFAGVLDLVRPLLGGRDWRKLGVALAL